jgi:hypothetical protein
MLGTKKFLGAVASEIFGNVYHFAATVVTLTWVTFRVLICKDRALRFENAAGNKVFARNHLESVSLAIELLL